LREVHVVHASEKLYLLSFLCIVTLAAANSSVPRANGADVVSTWNGTTGNWTDFTRWSSNPLYPNDGNGGFTYDVVVNSGTITQDLLAGITVEKLTFGGGTIGGDYNLTVNDLSAWTGGTMSGTGSTRIEPSSMLNVSGSGTKTLYRTLNNAGTVAWSGSGTICPDYGAVIVNSGTFDAQSDASLSSSHNGTAPRFDNLGLFKKSGGSGITSMGNYWWTFNNSGTVRVQSGTLLFYSDFNNTATAEVQAGKLDLAYGGTSTGSFGTSPGGVLAFSGGTHNLSGATFTNAGIINFNGATANFGTPVTMGGNVNISSGTVNFNASATLSGPSTISGGTLGGTGQATFSNLTWTGGTMSGAGGSTRVELGSVLNISGSGSKSLLYRTLNNAGTVAWSGSGTISPDYGAVILNSGMFDAQSDASLLSGGIGAAPRVDNSGLFEKSSGTGTTTVGNYWTFNNSGTVRAQSGTLLFSTIFDNTGTAEAQGGTLRLNGTVTQLSGSTLTGGTWIVRPSSTLLISTGSNVTVNRGDVTLDGSGSTFAKINTLTSNEGHFGILNGRDFTSVGGLSSSGTLTVGSGSTLTVNGSLDNLASGRIQGGGVIAVGENSLTNNGTISPGLSPGLLTVNGTFDQTATGSLALDLASDSSYDALRVNGSVGLSGGLDVQLGYAPDPLSAFLVLDNDGPDSIVGNFAGLPEGSIFYETFGVSSVRFQVSYLGGTGNDVVLTVMGLPGDTNGDGKVNDVDAQVLATHWGNSGADWADGDFNGDEVVNAADASILAANWGHGTSGESSSVPEPSAFTLMAVGLCGLVALTRRRKQA
jgi:fibronectin-binding autotransporter adhesin